MRKPRFRETKELAAGVTLSKRQIQRGPPDYKFHALSIMSHRSHLSGLWFLHFPSTALTPEVTGVPGK